MPWEDRCSSNSNDLGIRNVKDKSFTKQSPDIAMFSRLMQTALQKLDSLIISRRYSEPRTLSYCFNLSLYSIAIAFFAEIESWLCLIAASYAVFARSTSSILSLIRPTSIQNPKFASLSCFIVDAEG